MPDLSFASDGFVILIFMFVAMGFAMPVPYTIYWQGLIFFEYLMAQPFVHFPELPMMIVLGIPVYLGNIAMTIAMEHTFEDQYANKKALEFAFSHDPLTGCYNRNIFADPKLGFIEDFTENFSQYTFLLYDLDDFKKINDTYGHDVGDQILRLVTEAVKKELKDEDFFVRWGGEEFLVVTKGGAQRATDLAHDMNKAVDAIEYEGRGVTISIGIAAGVSDNYRETIKAADNAMYKAKAEGKNKACW